MLPMQLPRVPQRNSQSTSKQLRLLQEQLSPSDIEVLLHRLVQPPVEILDTIALIIMAFVLPSKYCESVIKLLRLTYL